MHLRNSVKVLSDFLKHNNTLQTLDISCTFIMIDLHLFLF